MTAIVNMEFAADIIHHRSEDDRWHIVQQTVTYRYDDGTREEDVPVEGDYTIWQLAYYEDGGKERWIEWDAEDADVPADVRAAFKRVAS